MSARTAVRSIVGSAKRLASTAPGSSTQVQPSPPGFSSPSSSSSVSASSSSSPHPAPAKRIYTARKTFLHEYYSHLLRTSQVVLLFSHDNLTVSNLQAIRRAIAKVPVPPTSNSLTAPSSSSSSSSGDETLVPGATLTIARTGLLSSLFKPSTSDPSAPSFKPFLAGPTALITSPSLSPAYLQKLLSSLTRALRKTQKEIPANTPPENVKQPKLTLVAGILEGSRLVDVKQVEEVGKLPELDVLRAQVVGLLEGQGRGLLGVVSLAGGGSLVRTLQGLEEGLKKEQQGGASASAAA